MPSRLHTPSSLRHFVFADHGCADGDAAAEYSADGVDLAMSRSSPSILARFIGIFSRPHIRFQRINYREHSRTR